MEQRVIDKWCKGGENGSRCPHISAIVHYCNKCKVNGGFISSINFSVPNTCPYYLEMLMEGVRVEK